MLTLLAVMMMTLTATTAMAQGSGNNDGEITGQETPQYIGNAGGLKSACEQSSGNEDKLYILTADIETDDEFTVNSCLKLDLYGHSIVSEYGCFNINDNATLTVVDRSTGEQKGSIICNDDGPSHTIYTNNGSKFIADGITITSANGYAISNIGGTAEISGCTVIGVKGILNSGTTTVTGGSISGTFMAIDNFGGTISVNTSENPAACTISGGEWGIFNDIGGSVTLGSGINLTNCSNSGIYQSDGTVTLNAWPTFSAGSTAGFSDIMLLQGKKITIGSAITAAPTTKIRVRVTGNGSNDLALADLPYTFTSGYASNVTDGSSNVIDPAEVFTYYKSNPYIAVALDATSSSESVIAINPAKAPVTFAFAEGQEWMTWCSEASFTKPDGIDAYTIDDATPEAITVTPITATDASQPAVLPAYTPLLLHKNGTDGLTAQLDDVPAAPDGVYDSSTGIVTVSTQTANIYGSTKEVLSNDAIGTYLSKHTYMLVDGAFILVGQIDGFAANRCWLRLKTTSNARRLEIRSGDATGVKEAKEVKESIDNTWYSLTGIRLESRPDRKGIYINGGKKVIIK